MDDVSTSDGVFSHEYGADATSLAELGGNVRIDELQAGQIDHAIGLEIGDDASAQPEFRRRPGERDRPEQLPAGCPVPGHAWGRREQQPQCHP